MNEYFRNIVWKDKSHDFQPNVIHDLTKSIIPLDSGLEAGVFKISTLESTLVLKVWNRDSKPDVSFQYKLLESLYHLGIAVSKPLGWGMDADHHQVLLTSFDGESIHKVNRTKLATLAEILTEVHSLPLEALGELPRYDFVSYFYPGIDDHPDIKAPLMQLVEQSKMEQACLIHGDYNLGNILEAEGSYKIIDWTNGQLGDSRYDIAWSVILIWIYVSERDASVYRSIFLTKYSYTRDELEIFEAIACLRWILLNRIADLPKRKNTISTVRSIILNNIYLTEGLL